MPNCKSMFPFAGTKEQSDCLEDAIAKHRDQKGALMPILQEAQEIYGYLPEEIIIQIADSLDMPSAEVYGVASFYSQFTFNPKGEHKISVCMGTACYVKGSGEILSKVCEKVNCKPGKCSEDGKFSIDAVRCVGACGLSPVMSIDDEVYGRLTVDKIDSILEKYMK